MLYWNNVICICKVALFLSLDFYLGYYPCTDAQLSVRNLSVTYINDTSVRLSWLEPSSASSTSVDHAYTYRVVCARCSSTVMFRPGQRRLNSTESVAARLSLQSQTTISRHSQACQNPRRDQDQDLWPFDPKMNGFPGLMLEPYVSRLVILAASGFETSCGKQTDRQTPVKNLTPRLPSRAWHRFYIVPVGVAAGRELSSFSTPLGWDGSHPKRRQLSPSKRYSRSRNSQRRGNGNKRTTGKSSGQHGPSTRVTTGLMKTSFGPRGTTAHATRNKKFS